MNREAAPLLVGLMVPLLLVGAVYIQIYIFDLWAVMMSIDILYYIVLFPIILGLAFALMNRKE